MPITLPNFSAYRPEKGLVSDLGTALEAYMAQKSERLKQEGQGYENLYSKARGERAEDVIQSEIDRNKSEGAKRALELALLEKFGGAEKQSEIDYKNAQTKYYNEAPENGMGRRGGLSQSARVWSSAPANIKEEMIAQARGVLGPKFDDNFIMNHFYGGGTMDDLRELASQEGRDPNTTEKVYSTTASGRNTLQQQEGSLAELGVLEDEITKGMEKYGGNLMWGHSPQQVMDAISGHNDEEQGKFLAARALQIEAAGARTRIAGGSNAAEALKEMRENSLSEIKIFRPLVSQKAWTTAQEEINKTLKKALHAKSKYLKGQTNSKELYGDEDKADAIKSSGDPMGLR
jgi:hypothetical protein